MRGARAVVCNALGLALASALLGACDTAPAGGERRRGRAEAAGSDASVVAPGACAVADVAESGAAMPVRLTRVQYRNAVADLLGLRTEDLPELGLPPDPAAQGLARGEGVPALLAERYFTSAEQLAAHAVRDLDTLLGCDRGRDGDAACARSFIAAFGRRAYRRPLHDAERAALFELYAGIRVQLGFSAAIQAVVQALLASPRFLYLPPSGEELPGGYAVATQLAAFLWNSAPDDALLDAAADAQLERAAGIAAQAQRMLADVRAARGLRDFYRDWLGLEALDGHGALAKDPGVYPELEAALARDLRASLERFLDEALSSEHAVSALLRGGFDYRNARLAAVYGAAGVQGEALQRVTPEPARHAGLLTHPALLGMLGKPNQSDPVQRGRFVRERLLCQTLPQPPSELILAAPDPDPTRSTRQRFADHAAEPLCAGCHRLLDPIGFGFEHYDGIGRFREMDNGVRVNAEGELRATLDADGAFEGAIELSERLAGSADVHACITRQLLRRALAGREPSAACVEHLASELESSGGDLRALRVAISASGVFGDAPVPEVAP